jgi:hypothetical protein
MTWTAPRPRLEILIEWTAAACLGGAVGFALWRLAPTNPALPALPSAAGVGALVAALGLWLQSLVTERGADLIRFNIIDFTAPGFAPDDVLLLDDPVVAAPAGEDQDRVVHLFAGHAPAAAEVAERLPAPGEMVARIETFLGSSVTRLAVPEAPAPAADASAALHAALADIRRSLRHA